MTKIQINVVILAILASACGKENNKRGIYSISCSVTSLGNMLMLS